ncbi:hypothetical protein Mal35_41850 [Gimesia maris]|uniref:hypothetical protein n=1 Tax=Gimesia maris TaxID=122 RepID=UPI00118942C0|nr:hypothetical protein [Gimesia maris]QDT80711.1 hypothetical protein Mal35_41850 [Gimesia maris]
MTDSAESNPSQSDPQENKTSISPWKITSWISCIVVAGSILACVIIAAVRSECLTQVKVTALDAAAEPRDHDLPLIRQKEALPDYELLIITQERIGVKLGAKPDTSAVKGLVWKLNQPIGIHDIVGIRLQDQDKLISDALVEVPFSRDPVVAGNYRFEFQTVYSVQVGVQSFFQTPIGLTIAFAFVIAVLLILVNYFDLDFN